MEVFIKGNSNNILKKIDMSKIGLKSDEFPKKYMKYDLQDVDGRKPNFHRNRAGQERYDFW